MCFSSMILRYCLSFIEQKIYQKLITSSSSSLLYIYAVYLCRFPLVVTYSSSNLKKCPRYYRY